MRGFWTVASAHVLHLLSIVVQVFSSSEKYGKTCENYFQEVECFQGDSGSFRMDSANQNPSGRAAKWREEFLGVGEFGCQVVPRKNPGAPERCRKAPKSLKDVKCWKQKSAGKL